MKRISQSPLLENVLLKGSNSRPQRCFNISARRLPNLADSTSTPSRSYLHTTTATSATVTPLVAPGPPPKAPIPSAEHVDSRVARRRKQADLLKRGQDLRAIEGGKGSGTAKQKRFWKDVHVKHADGADI